MTKYKYTRKELLKRLEKDFYKYMGGKEDFNEDLLAQKEDRKEKVELFNVTGVPLNTPIMFKRKNGRIGYGKVKPTHSPLEIEEIEEISDGDMRCLEDTRLIDKLWEKQCQIIRNQKKLYQYIKEKKI